MRHRDKFKMIGKHVVLNDIKIRLVCRFKENPIKILSDFFSFMEINKQLIKFI